MHNSSLFEFGENLTLSARILALILNPIMESRVKSVTVFAYSDFDLIVLVL